MESNGPRVALVDESLLKCDGEFKGFLVKERILVFSDRADVLSNSQSSIKGRLGSNGEILLSDNRIVKLVIIIPSVSHGRKVLRVDDTSTLEDEFLTGISLFNRSQTTTSAKGTEINQSTGDQSEEAEDGSSSSVQKESLRVPRLFIKFARAFSLASDALLISSEDDIRWRHVSTTVALSHSELHATSSVTTYIDCVLGVAALIFIMANWSQVISLLDGGKWGGMQEWTLKDRVEFVMSQHAPLGFKLNPQVDYVLGNLVIIIVDAWQAGLSRLIGYAAELLVMSVATGIWLNRRLGLSVILAVLSDWIMVITVHLGILHRIISRILTFQLRLIGSLALLMRGKKRNILRHRVDTLKTDSAQLMLGTMAIFFFSFTLQTTLAYHLLIVAAWTVVFMFCSLLFIVIVALRTLPIDELFQARKDSQAKDGCHKPKRFYLSPDDRLKVWRLVVVPVSAGDVVGEWIRQIAQHWTRAWTRRWGAEHIFRGVIAGRELPSVPTPDF